MAKGSKIRLTPGSKASHYQPTVRSKPVKSATFPRIRGFNAGSRGR